ncbi:MAG: class I SAM-dependent methyltransferase [Anaerolineae bacterium]|nr:class I SAM-dependent methyltransferase [Anaerolineae bacterium]
MSTVAPVVRSKDEAKASYNRMSRWYDRVAGNSEKKYRDIGLEKLNAQPGEHILEIGYGTGHCVQALATAVTSSGQVCGIDISEGMNQIAQARIEKAGLSENVDLHVGDASTLPFSPESFDGVFMSFTLELFDTPEIPQVLQQCYTVLRPGGRIAVVSLIKKPGKAVAIYEWFHKKMPTAVDCRPIHAQSDIVTAGFTLQNVSALSMWGLPVEIIVASK